MIPVRDDALSYSAVGATRVADERWDAAPPGLPPVRVVAVADEPSRRGFAYGTRPGHPVSGEEAFVVHRSADGGVWLTLRSLPGRPEAAGGSPSSVRWWRSGCTDGATCAPSGDQADEEEARSGGH